MGDGLLSLSWNNHKATFCHILSTLRDKEKYTDVTVACEGRFYPVHKLVLSTCSEYFEKIFDNTPCKHPVIVLKDIAWDELEALLSYMYDGVVSVAQNDLARLIKAAEVLRIKGLAVPDEPPPSRNDIGSRKSSQRSSDDRSSPHPKRRRREENMSHSGARTSPPSSPGRTSPRGSESEPSKAQADSRWSKEQSSDKPLDDRLHQSASGGAASSPPEIMVDESLVKEEIEDNLDNRDDIGDSGMDYGSLGSDSRLDGSVGGDDEGQKLPNKFERSGEQSEAQSQPLSDSVVEALAGPSGMQGWLGGCDVPGAFSGMEGYSGEGSQDVHPSQQGPPGSGVQSGAHQMIMHGNDWMWEKGRGRDERDSAEDPTTSTAITTTTASTKKLHQCLLCDFSTTDRSYFRRHNFKHSGKMPYQCQYCSYCATTPSMLRQHLRKHTGEKPFACNYCPYTASYRNNLKDHIRKHTGERPFACPYCHFRSAQRSNLKTHVMKMHKNRSFDAV